MKKKIILLIVILFAISGCKKTEEETNKYEITDQLRQNVKETYETAYALESIIEGNGYKFNDNYIIVNNVKYYKINDDRFKTLDDLTTQLANVYNEFMVKYLTEKIHNGDNKIIQTDEGLYLNVNTTCILMDYSEAEILSYSESGIQVKGGDVTFYLDENNKLAGNYFLCKNT